MKFIIMFGSLIIAILFGMTPSLFKPKPFWWKITAILLICFSLALTILPRTAGNLSLVGLLKSNFYKQVDLKVQIDSKNNKFDPQSNTWDIKLLSDSKYNNVLFKGQNLPEELKSGNNIVIAKFSYDKNIDRLIYLNTVEVNPMITYPLVPNLEERIKILNLHVPQAWIAVIAYMFAMIWSIQYLRTQKMDYDIYVTSASALGTLFAILATVTGMLWAKFNWGTYWNWDPRQTSIFVLILIYLAYFALRSAIDNEERRARFSSVYSIIAFITVPFLVFVLPRLSQGLHPGSADDVNSGPVVSKQANALDSNMVWGFGLGLLAFTIIFFWLMNISIRSNKLKHKLHEINH